MLPSTDNLPAEVTLPVPRVYRDYLVQKRLRVLVQTALWGVLAYVAVCIAFYGKAASVAPHVAGLLATIAFGGKWRELRSKTWHYTLDEEQFRLLWWMYEKDKVWNWYSLKWQRDGVLRVEHEEWRGLPCLRLVTDKTTANLVMVYAHEDKDNVQNLVLPLIEKYRKQYRNPLWATRLRQEKQTL